jgi:anti-sigma factor RsiW
MIDSDSLFVAYVDGELDTLTAQKVEALLAVDLHALQRVQIFRATASILRAAYDEDFYAEKKPAQVLPRWRDGPAGRGAARRAAHDRRRSGRCRD